MVEPDGYRPKEKTLCLLKDRTNLGIIKETVNVDLFKDSVNYVCVCTCTYSRVCAYVWVSKKQNQVGV